MSPMSQSKAMSASDNLTVSHGWTLAAHPLFLDQLERLVAAVETERLKSVAGSRPTANAKLLAALFRLVFDIIPSNPGNPDYRQGSTLGQDRKHWFRAKFGNQRFRLFFRYSTQAKLIIFAWVNDEQSLRTYGARTDAYAVFRSMLDSGNPPEDWTELSKAALDRSSIERFASSTDRTEK